MIDSLIAFDKELLVAINQQHSPFLDGVMWWISGTTTWWPFYLFLISAIFYKYKWKGFWLLLGIALVITLADQGSVKLFKDVFQRLRPCHQPGLQSILHLVNNKCGGQYGFVSSHAANSFALATFLSYVLRSKWITILLFTYAVLVSYSRMYLGVHFPADIMGGAILGTALGSIVYKALNYLGRKCLNLSI